MHRVIGVIAAASLAAMTGGGPLGVDLSAERESAPSLDVGALLTAARGAPPLICALAARSVRGDGWGRWSDAPSTPLGAVAGAAGVRDIDSEQLSAADVDRLMAALSESDPCVRELSIRLLGDQKDQRVTSGLVSRLGASEPALREVAAYGLGLLQAKSAVDPLIGVLHDGTAGVRANGAWALGHLRNGRALTPLVGLFGDRDSLVREAAVIAAGRMDSTSIVGTLARVLTQDPAPDVRRAAAWALGQLDAPESADALAQQLGRDTDARVREMSAWALGNVGRRGGSSSPALAAAARRDADDRVRETATWALANVNDRSSVQVLGEIAASDKSARVRGTAAWALGQLRGDEGKAPAGLRHVLRDESDDARLKAAWALGQIGDASALNDIRDALKVEQNDQVRRALVRALIRSGGRSEATLTDLLSSSDPQVREAAVRGLAGNNSFNPWPWPWPRPRPIP